MFQQTPSIIVIVLTLINTVLCGYSVEIISDAPVVVGASVTFNATVYYDGQEASGSFKFEWSDNAIYKHTRNIEKDGPRDSWTVSYSSRKMYPPGPYIVQVVISKYILLFPYQVTSQRISFKLTETLNGMMLLKQDKVVPAEFVSNSSTVTHQIVLCEPEMDFLNKSATSVLTYWFVDCNYYGMSDDYQFELNYTIPEREHTVEALVLASFEPWPVPTTTTTTTTTTTVTPPTTSKPITTTTPTPKSTTTPATPSIASTMSRRRRNVITNFANSTTGIVAKVHGEFFSVNGSSISYNDSVQFFCSNNTIIPLGSNMTYGYFSRKVHVKQPISNIVVSGNNWLQHGEMLQLSVACQGSSAINYCYMFKSGIHNITGNETCIDPDISEKCDFPISRLLISDRNDSHTLIIVIYNDVSKMVKQVTVTVYKVTQQAQLSVIVVPVAFSLVAVVLIVFGVAYYIQNRSRFIVEVADFNFGQQYGDMEYKTFRERLRDSMANAFTRAPLPGSSEGPVWPPSRKYGSMT